MRRRARASLILCALMTGACSTPSFRCDGADECISSSGAQGRCEVNQRCSFPDQRCPSGSRYSEYAGDVSERCVDDSMAGEARFLGSVFAVAESSAEAVVDLSELPEASAGKARVVLAFISSKSFSPPTSVTSEAGAWTRLAEQCSARSTTGASVWRAEAGTGSSLQVVLEESKEALVVVVAAFELGAAPGEIAVLDTVNSLGSLGGCNGDPTDDSPTFDIPVVPTLDGTVVVAVAPRNRTVQGETGTTLLVSRTAGVAGNEARMALLQATSAALDDGVVSGSFENDPQDWAALVLEIR